MSPLPPIVASLLFALAANAADPREEPLPKGAIARLGSLAFRNELSTQSLQFSSDGRLLAGGSFDGAVHVWDATTGRTVWTTGAMGGG